eukprot:19590-Heterococcus_DN1.PRE.2
MLQLLAMALSLQETHCLLSTHNAHNSATPRPFFKRLSSTAALCTGQRLCSTTALRGDLTSKRSAVYNAAARPAVQRCSCSTAPGTVLALFYCCAVAQHWQDLPSAATEQAVESQFHDTQPQYSTAVYTVITSCALIGVRVGQQRPYTALQHCRQSTVNSRQQARVAAVALS